MRNLLIIVISLSGGIGLALGDVIEYHGAEKRAVERATPCFEQIVVKCQTPPGGSCK